MCSRRFEQFRTFTLQGRTDYVQSGYAADLSYVANLCFSKLSVLFLLCSITPVARQRSLTLAVAAITVLWSLASEFVAAFQCRLPSPWRFMGNKCIDRVRSTLPYQPPSELEFTYAILDCLLELLRSPQHPY